MRCDCTGQCQTNRCTCHKNGYDCTTHCHSSRSCRNVKDPSQTTLRLNYITEDHLGAIDKKEWLTDLHMRGVSELLKMANSHMDGLQDPILQINHTWRVPTSEFIQIFNKDSCHWVTVSSVGLREGAVGIYDSLHGTKFSTSFLQDVVAFCQPRGDKLVLHTMNVQRQRDSFSCGIHAAAFATSLAYGQDPCELRYQGADKHLRDGLARGHLRPFPAEIKVNNKRIIATFSLDI